MFKIGDTVFNKNRNAMYTLDAADIIRFAGEELLKVGVGAINIETNEKFIIKDIFEDGYSWWVADKFITNRLLWGTGRFGNLYPVSSVKLWLPEENEWCWFFDNENDTPLLSPFYCMDNNKFASVLSLYETEDDGETVRSIEKYLWDYCLPFTGKILSK